MYMKSSGGKTTLEQLKKNKIPFNLLALSDGVEPMLRVESL